MSDELSMFDHGRHMYRGHGFMRQRGDRLRHYQNMVVPRSQLRNDRQLFKSERGMCIRNLASSGMMTMRRDNSGLYNGMSGMSGLR